MDNFKKGLTLFLFFSLFASNLNIGVDDNDEEILNWLKFPDMLLFLTLNGFVLILLFSENNVLSFDKLLLFREINGLLVFKHYSIKYYYFQKQKDYCCLRYYLTKYYYFQK